MVASEAPKAYRTGSWKAEKPTVSTAAAISSRVTELPRIRWASTRRLAPSWIAARGAPPCPAKAAKADTSVMMGKVIPTPVRATSPTSGMWPM